jgi:hypothetical protein
MKWAMGQMERAEAAANSLNFWQRRNFCSMTVISAPMNCRLAGSALS